MRWVTDSGSPDVWCRDRSASWRPWEFQNTKGTDWETFHDSHRQSARIGNLNTRNLRPRSTVWLSRAARSVATGSQWSRPMKSFRDRFHWTAPLVFHSNWSHDSARYWIGVFMCPIYSCGWNPEDSLPPPPPPPGRKGESSVQTSMKYPSSPKKWAQFLGRRTKHKENGTWLTWHTLCGREEVNATRPIKKLVCPVWPRQGLRMQNQTCITISTTRSELILNKFSIRESWHMNVRQQKYHLSEQAKKVLVTLQ